MKYLANLILLIAVSFSFTVSSQHTNFNTQRNWSLNKKEILFGAGATQFLGDLGGRNQIGKGYSLVDLDLPSTGYGGMIGFRYRFHPYWATTTSLNVGLLRGDDAQTNEVIRNSRNLNFRSIILELHQRIDLIIFANEKYGNRYDLRGHSKKMKDKNFQFYVFGGVGISYFNPKGKYNGSWVKLRPLNTEGQGLTDGAKKTLPITATIPAGVGFRVGINRMWRLGIEATYVKTFSDYIDDVSGSYYDRNLLEAFYGTQSAVMSNPSVNNTVWFGTGAQRGDDGEKDAYFYLNLVVARNITYKDYGRMRRSYKWKGRYKF